MPKPPRSPLPLPHRSRAQRPTLPRTAVRFAGRAALLLASLTQTLACGANETESGNPPETKEGPKDGLPETCNPLRTSGACLLPYPDSVFTKEDESSPTGVRLDLTTDLFPENNLGVPFNPTRLERLDGFSPATQIIAYFPDRLDPTSLPNKDAPEKSLTPQSTTAIVDMETGERVAHFAEADAQAFKDDDRQTLILRPLKRLEYNRRYAVAITHGVKTLDGKSAPSPEGWARILDNTAITKAGKRRAQRMPDILSALSAAGVAKEEITLAWDFQTGSEMASIGTLLSMREETLSALATETFAFTVDKVEDDFSDSALRRVTGTFEAPQYISQTDLKNPDATLTFNENGKPLRKGTLKAPFTLMLPRAAETAPVRLLVFGHGFLGTAESELGDQNGSYVQTFLDEKGYAAIATNWSGLSSYEGIDSQGSSAAALAVKDMNNLHWITDRLAQSIINQIVLAKVGKTIANDPSLQVNGAPSVDVSRIDYYGISLGGVMGSVLLGVSPDIQQGVFNVGAASWTTLLQRSTNWALFKLILDGSYPDKLDQQVLICVLQSYFDSVDGIHYGPHYFSDPLAGNPSKQILLQIAVGDLQVSNLAAEVFARTSALPLLDSSPLAIWGLPPTGGPLPSALTVWDTQEADQPPDGNLNASVTADNNAHAELRLLPAVNDQIDHFFRQAEVISTCDGKCDPQ